MEENIVVSRRRSGGHGLGQSFLIKYGLKALLAFVVVLVFLTLTQCTVKKPVAPTWTTQMTIPLVNRVYLMPEIIRKIDQPGLSLDTAGNVLFSVDQQLDTIRISDNLNTADINQSATEVLGEVSLAPTSPDPMTVNLSDYVTLNLGAVPPTSFDIQEDFPPIEDFNWATVSSGSLDFIIINDFSIDLDTVIVSLVDLENSEIISTVAVPTPGIPAGSADTLAFDLGGQTISNQFRIDMHCHTPGGLMLSLEDKSMTSSLDCRSGFIVSAAEAEIPTIVKNFSQSVALSESNTIMSAEMASGNLSLQVRNGTNLASTFQISLPDFVLDGVSYSTTRQIAPNSTDSVSIDLTNYTFQPVDQVSPQDISIEVVATIDSTAPVMATVDQYDSISVTALITDISYSSMTGIIDSTSAPFDGLNADIDLPKGFDSLQLVNASLIMELSSGVDFPADLNIDIAGNGGQNLALAGTILPGTYDNPMMTFIIDTNLAAFLNPVPSSITITGAAIFGDGQTVGTVTADDFIASRIIINSPLEAVIGQTTFDGDVGTQNIDQDDIDLATEHILEAQFTASIINHLPLGVSVEIYFSGDSTTVYSDPELVIGPLQIEPGITGPDHTVDSAIESQNVISLDSTDIKILEHQKLYSGQVITLVGSNGLPVKISGDDYLTTCGVIQINYRFDDSF
jgi:hypothetical protein